MFSAFKNVISYVVEKRFFIAIQKTNHKREIIVDSEVIDGSEIFVHRPISILKDFRVAGKLKLGNNKNIISDENGKLLHSKLSKETASDGELLGFNYGVCLPVKIKGNLNISPKNKDTIYINNIYYNGDYIKNNLFYDFILPSTFVGNEIRYNFYMISDTKETQTVSLNHGISSLEDYNNSFNNLTKSTIKIKPGINISETFRTNIMNNDPNNFDFNFSNKMMRFEFFKDISFGHSNTLLKDLYILGLKLEFDTNQYNNF